MNVIAVAYNRLSWQPWLGLLIALGGLGTLPGCASNPNSLAGASGRADLLTDSDEPESRKRARIRLELALGYFEQGQTTIALDEVKLALLADPQLPEAHNLRGLVYMRLNDLALAQDSFLRAMALDPGNMPVLHNLAWLQCQQGRFIEAVQSFGKVLADPKYQGRAKTWMTQGLCQIRAGQGLPAELSLIRSYELDPANPITGYNLAQLLFQRGDLARSQFYVRRLNNSELANAESLWLGIKVERRLDNQLAVRQLAEQLKKRFPQSNEFINYERGGFDE